MAAFQGDARPVALKAPQTHLPCSTNDEPACPRPEGLCGLPVARATAGTARWWRTHRSVRCDCGCAAADNPPERRGRAGPESRGSRSRRRDPILAHASEGQQEAIAELVERSGSTLTDTVGIGPIIAGRLIARTGRPSRFPSSAAYANYAGAAPVEVASADKTRQRVSRTGDRQLNAVLHAAAIV